MDYRAMMDYLVKCILLEQLLFLNSLYSRTLSSIIIEIG